MKDNAPILNIANLVVDFKTGKGQIFNAVKGIHFDLRAGETLALVGESGSGKSVTALSILRLLSANASFGKDSSITYRSQTNLITASDNDLRDVRGNKIAMIFQEPMTSLNPLHTIGRQIHESLKIHTQLNKKEAENLDIFETDNKTITIIEWPQLIADTKKIKFIKLTFSYSNDLLNRSVEIKL